MRTDLENFIKFAKTNGLMGCPFERVLNEYETTKMYCDEFENLDQDEM